MLKIRYELWTHRAGCYEFVILFAQSSVLEGWNVNHQGVIYNSQNSDKKCDFINKMWCVDVYIFPD